ncbi:MAG: class I SAM-dependent methyltransferase, partial [Chloroflexota bacterium]
SSFENKKQIVTSYLDRVQPETVWDLGANTGIFSRLASQRRIQTVAFDIDPGAVELNYRQSAAEDEKYLLPLLSDLTNPSPNLGWHNRERSSLAARGPVDMLFALALVHHLAITNNVPFDHIAGFTADLGDWMIIEFIPKHDPQAQKLLASREDIFSDYTLEKFEEAFKAYYRIEDSAAIENSERILYLMKKI